jgi:hypothetical protein
MFGKFAFGGGGDGGPEVLFVNTFHNQSFHVVSQLKTMFRANLFGGFGPGGFDGPMPKRHATLYE